MIHALLFSLFYTLEKLRHGGVIFLQVNAEVKFEIDEFYSTDPVLYEANEHIISIP